MPLVQNACREAKAALRRTKRLFLKGKTSFENFQLAETHYRQTWTAAKHEFRMQLAKNASHNPWDSIRQLIGSKKSRARVRDLTPNNDVTNQEQADKLAEEFEAICDVESGDELRSSVHSFLDRHDISFPEVCLYELRDAIFAPKTRSAAGVDHITVPALRILWTHQRFALLRLVNSCLQNFPEYFKLALIHPIPKGSAAQGF